jgi:hypothetical protein
MAELPEGLAASLPGVESKLLRRAVIEACERINNGDPEAGYQCLLAGLERATEYAETGRTGRLSWRTPTGRRWPMPVPCDQAREHADDRRPSGRDSHSNRAGDRRCGGLTCPMHPAGTTD